MIARTIVIATATAALFATGTAPAQNYPTHPIRVIASDAGGGSDIVLRQIVEGLNSSLKQPVVVDNSPGGVIPGQRLAQSAPDGYTLLYFGQALWLLPLLRKDVPYDVLRDFAPITAAINQPNVLIVHPSVPAKSVGELIALIKSKPGELNYASAAIGTSNHLAAELFQSMTGTRLVRIPYKGGGAALTAVVAGDVQLMFSVAASAVPQIKAGKVRALGVTSLKPLELLPGVPAIAAGLPGYESASLGALFAPAKTPDAIVSRLNQETVRALGSAELRKALANSGIEVVASSPGELQAMIKAEIAKWGKVIRDAGIKEE